MRNNATGRDALKSMNIHKKHARGSSGFQESESGPNKSETLPDLHRRTPSEASHSQENDSDEERWRDCGGESGEVV
ncbi:MAG: hypothetical protein WEF53_10470 [Bacteroidota bacterium]